MSSVVSVSVFIFLSWCKNSRSSITKLSSPSMTVELMASFMSPLTFFLVSSEEERKNPKQVDTIQFFILWILNSFCYLNLRRSTVNTFLAAPRDFQYPWSELHSNGRSLYWTFFHWVLFYYCRPMWTQKQTINIFENISIKSIIWAQYQSKWLILEIIVIFI